MRRFLNHILLIWLICHVSTQANSQATGSTALNTVEVATFPTAINLFLKDTISIHCNNPKGVLFDNGPFITHPGGGVGGSDYSILQNPPLTTWGYGAQVYYGNRLSDDFTVPANGWEIDSIIVFAYQTGSTTASTITSVNMRIWNGKPGSSGAYVVWGNSYSNKLINTYWSNCYRGSALNNTERPIMRNVCQTSGLSLNAGTYWVDWQIDGSLSSGPWVIPITILGTYTTGNAVQYQNNISSWVDVKDVGYSQGLPFIIYGDSPNISITSPQLGNNWQAGSSHNITWNSSGVVNVKLEYSTTNGSSWKQIIASTPASNGSYNWSPIPNEPSTQCKIRLKSVANPSIYAISNSFIICSLFLTSPIGGEKWQVNSKHDITWNSAEISNIRLDYSVNNGTSWHYIGATSASSGSYMWPIPDDPSNQCKIRVSNAADLSVYAVNEIPFTISKLTLTSPNGFEIWEVGSSKNVTWNSSFVSNINIDYSINKGQSWLPIASNQAASQGYYSWLVPNNPSSNCLVKLTDGSNATIYDVSDTLFTIYNPYPNSLTINAYYEFPNPRDVSSYKIAGLPGNISIPLANVIPGTFNVNWIAFWDNGSDWDYMQANQSYAFKPGYAYWISSEQPVAIQQTVPTVTLSVDNTYTIPVHSGWNIISNPLHLNVYWSAIRSVNGLDNGYKLYVWDGYWTESDVMALNRGYYFYNSGNLSGLKIPYYPAMKLISLYEEQLYTPAVFMKLHSETKQLASISIVFHPESSFDYDRLDRLIPPGDFEKTGIRIIAPQLSIGYKQLTSEYRPVIGEGQEYPIQVKNKTDEPCVISTTLSDMTKGLEIWLVNNRINQAVNLNEENSLNVYPSNEPWNYTLYIGSYDYIKQHIDLNRLILYPGLTCYPNPVTGKSAIGFTLPSEGDVEILLMDISGRSTHQLFNGKLCEGYHEVLISSSTTNAGVYFAKIVISLNGQDELMTDFVRIVVFD